MRAAAGAGTSLSYLGLCGPSLQWAPQGTELEGKRTSLHDKRQVVTPVNRGARRKL